MYGKHSLCVAFVFSLAVPAFAQLPSVGAASPMALAADTRSSAAPTQTTQPVPTATGKAVTIESLAEAQKQGLELDALKQMGVSVQPVPVMLPAPIQPIFTKRATSPGPAAPYLASVFGPVGQEKATFILNSKELHVKAGDAIQGWEIIAIRSARVQVYPSESRQDKLRKSPRAAIWISVGDSLK